MKTLLIALVAALALPAGAIAKELESAQICGAAGCTEAKDKQALVAVFEDGGPRSTPPTKGAPFYRVTIHIKGDPQAGHLLVAPAADRVRGFDGTWFSMPARNRRVWAAATHDVRPFPASKLPDVDPNASPPMTGGALPPRTYNAAGPPKAPFASDDGGIDWWVPAGIAAALVAMAAGLLLSRRRPLDPEGPAS